MRTRLMEGLAETAPPLEPTPVCISSHRHMPGDASAMARRFQSPQTVGDGVPDVPKMTGQCPATTDVR